ncbi:MAG TPA: hypothetical protein VFT04_14620 [Gemmatimonadales bacterium]|nr:hypothetical protein [Gemmatimonadales bacterium]
MSSPFPPRPGPVHISALITPALLAAAVPTFAQQPGASPAWGVGPTVAFVNFSAAGSDGEGAEAGFGRAVGAGIAVERSVGPLALLLAIEQLTTHVQVRDDAVVIEPQEPAVGRTRLGLALRGTLARRDGARVVLDAGPTLDIWSPDGSESRSSAGAAARIAVEMDAGPVTVENALGFGVSKGPLEASDLPEGYERKTLRTVTITIAARIGL